MLPIRPLPTVLAAAALALTACEPTPPEKSESAPAVAAAPPPSATGTVLTAAARDPDLTTLVSAIHTAGVAGTLEGAGPYTVFAPNNAAFEKVPAARRDFLTTPEGRPELRRLLTYHLVPGRLDSASLVQRIHAGGGALTLTTMQGGVLTARVNATGSIELTDAAGELSRIVQADVIASNGVLHAIDTVASPPG